MTSQDTQRVKDTNTILLKLKDLPQLKPTRFTNESLIWFCYLVYTSLLT